MVFFLLEKIIKWSWKKERKKESKKRRVFTLFSRKKGDHAPQYLQKTRIDTHTNHRLFQVRKSRQPLKKAALSNEKKKKAPLRDDASRRRRPRRPPLRRRKNKWVCLERSANFANLLSVSFDTTSNQQLKHWNFYVHANSTQQSRRCGVLFYFPRAEGRRRERGTCFDLSKAAQFVPRFCFCVVPRAFQVQLHTLWVPVSAE